MEISRLTAPHLHGPVLRDLFGPMLFRTNAPDLSWLNDHGGAVRQLAGEIYHQSAFHRMGELADAMLQAGCDREELLAHCRGSNPHVRGCWLLDLLMADNAAPLLSPEEQAMVERAIDLLTRRTGAGADEALRHLQRLARDNHLRLAQAAQREVESDSDRSNALEAM